MRKRYLVLAVVLFACAATTPALAVSDGTSVPDPKDAPWMVTIAFVGDRPLLERAKCGGVLIRPDRIATAAHCLDLADPTRLDVHLGASTLSTEHGLGLKIRGFATHPGYRIIPSPTKPNDFQAAAVADDVGIVQLAEPVRGVTPMPLADSAPEVGTPVQVYGHGLTGDPVPDAAKVVGDVLRRGDLRIIDDESCTKQLGPVVDGPTVLCAQSPTATFCSGDSGGPLVHTTASGPELVGIVSFGGEVVDKVCGRDGYPGAFTDAATVRPWLDQENPVLAPMPAAAPLITGTRTAGSTVTCQLPQWVGAVPDKVEFRWYGQRPSPDGFVVFDRIKDASAASLTLTAEQAQHQILCGVTASSAGGSVELFPEPL